MPTRQRAATDSTPAKRTTPAKKAAPDRATAKKATSRTTTSPSSTDRTGRDGSRPPAREVAATVAQQLQELTGKQPESIVSLSFEDDVWVIGIEVVESHRIPDSTDIMALYEVHADPDGSLRGYERTRRYSRGRNVDD